MRRIRITGRCLMLRVALCIALVSGSFTQARAADLLEQIKTRGFMRVGTFSIPPEAWIDIKTGEWRGVDADFTKALAKSIGVEVDPIVLVHAALVPALESGRVDVIVALYQTPDRQKVMAYNTEPVWYGADVLITQKRNTTIKQFPDMKGKVLGVTRASAQEIEASELQKKFGVGEIKKYESADPMLLDLKAGRLDAALWWGFTTDYALKQHPDYDFRVVEYIPPVYLGRETLPANYYVFPKRGSESLIKVFDAGLEKMREDGEGRKILEKYGLVSPSYSTGRP
jgi:ABC-type amino acid transport substrate-binding protein